MRRGLGNYKRINMRLTDKIKRLGEKRDIKRKDVYRFVVFLILSILFSFLASHYEKQLQGVTNVLFVIELAIIILFAYYFAGRAVMKSLFIIGAELTLIIYLAQTYCDIVPAVVRTADESMKSLLNLGLLYLGARFVYILYNEVINSADLLRKMNGNKKPWLILVPFAMLVGALVTQIGQVLFLIINNLCIYK